MNSTIEIIKSHRSIRKFKPEPLKDDLVADLVQCGQAAATSSNVQAVTVIQVKDDSKREKIAVLAGNQSYVETAGAFLVYCADMNRPKIVCERRDGSYAAGMTEQFVIATVDVALAAQNTVIAAESMGLGICYIGGIRNDPALLSEILEIPDYVYPVFGLCLGKPDQDPEVKPRLPVKAVLMQDKYSVDRFDDEIDNYDSQLRDYYLTRTGGKKDSNWSEEIKLLLGKESRPHMMSFLQKRGFLKK